MKLEESGKSVDTFLIKSIRKGDHLAFDQVFRKYGPGLYSFVLSILKDESESEEVVQDIFLKVWEKRKDLRSDLSFKSYLFTIAVNATRKFYRQKVQKDRYVQSVAIELSRNPSVEISALEYKNLLEYVDTLIRKLPPSRREIFVLSKKDGLKNTEIAERLKISEQTVKNQLVTAQKFLQAEAKKVNNELGFLFFTVFSKIS